MITNYSKIIFLAPFINWKPIYRKKNKTNTSFVYYLFFCYFVIIYGVSKSNIAKLQRVQNALCRIIFRLDKMSHVTPFLKKLHWLPIQHRILFKYNLLVFKAINLSQPPYLSALIRSSSLTRGNRLSISSTRPNKHIGRRGFAVAAPAKWNKLPQTVRSQHTIDGFRSQLKTYLFRLAYLPP